MTSKREDREALIARAKNAISEYDIAKARRVSVVPDRLAILLAELVAVFEQSLTPTGEERTPIVELDARQAAYRKHRTDAAAEFFRRPVQGEPTAEESREDFDRFIAALRAEWEAEQEADDEPCKAEIWSWDIFRHQEVDPYWMRCHLSGAHDKHKNSETGATWRLPVPDTTNHESEKP